MSVCKSIEYNGVTYKFQSSAATTILYKRMFKSDPEDFLRARNEKIRNTPQDVKDAAVRYSQIHERPDDDPEKRELLTKIATDPIFAESLITSVDFWQQYGFICYLEANTDPREISRKLTDDEYLAFVLMFTTNFFVTNTGVFQALHDENIQQTSKPKN